VRRQQQQQEGPEVVVLVLVGQAIVQLLQVLLLLLLLVLQARADLHNECSSSSRVRCGSSRMRPSLSCSWHPLERCHHLVALSSC
jgi:hypothetical protein